MSALTVMDLFSGIGGFSIGLESTGGFKTASFCEIDPFCRRVLAKHWPEVPCHDDVRTRQFVEGEADVIVGGFPCQDISRAGKRAGLSGERSGLYRELVRAIRVVRPKFAIVENVAALLGDGLDVVLGDLAEIGFDAEWDCIPACAVGAPHERDRVWIVAHASSAGFDGRPSEGLRREARDIAQGSTQSRDFREMGAAGLSPDADSSNPNDRHGHADETICAGRNAAVSSIDEVADPARIGCGQGGARRPADSFARVRDEARRNAADPYGARLSFGSRLGGHAQSEQSPAQRSAEQDGPESIWPDEPALCGVDDGLPHRTHRIAALGNAVIPKIPELIGLAILAPYGSVHALTAPSVAAE